MADLTVVRIVKPAHFKFRQFWVRVEVLEASAAKHLSKFQMLLMFNTKAEAEKVKPGYNFKG